MKRLLALCLILVCALSLAPIARADVIWDPVDSFYQRHSGECTYEDRAYYANGAEGYVTAWDAPDGSTVKFQYENGTKLWVEWVWKDWGLLDFWENGSERTGWIPLSDLVLVYDYLSFAGEYRDQIRAYEGEFASYNGDAQTVNFFEYPGAAAAKTHFDLTDQYIRENLTGGEDGNSSYIYSIFVDEQGLTWGYVSYMYGHLDGWFCLDEPDMESPAVIRDVGSATLIEARTPVMPAKGLVSAVLPWVLVAAVVAVTAVILAGLKKKAK